MQALDILQKTFGYTAFRGNQAQIINSVCSGKDTMVLMPTGGGKSLCYQVPALMMEGLTVVFSPLIALMKDQVDALRLNGVKAAYLNSTVPYAEQQSIIQMIRQNELKLLYIAPERLAAPEGQEGGNSAFFNFLKNQKVSLFAIDEAHCISHWGHDFRPDYLSLSLLKENFPDTPVVALTATADKQTRADILDKLCLPDPKVFLSSFNRPNIRYEVIPKQQSFGKLVTWLQHFPNEAGIVYCLSRKSTETTAAKLRDAGYDALPYHAGLSREERDRHQDLFLKDEVRIIVATIAFGMGIDKSNVRFVVHMDLPKNIESYYQETGRAGRDGLDSRALLFYTYADVVRLQGFIEVDGNEEQTAIMKHKLSRMAKYCEATTCRRKYLLNYFDEKAPDQCGNCDVCLANYEREENTVPAQKALSAVVRTGQQYGEVYLTKILTGSRSSSVKEEHKQIKTYGVGAEYDSKGWRDIYKALIQQGYLEVTTDKFQTLKLTQKSAALLKGEENFYVLRATNDTLAQGLDKQADSGFEEILFERLRLVRRQMAKAEGVAPYLVLGDNSLREMATYLPETPDHLKRIAGFGATKIEAYGEVFLKEIAAYADERDMPGRMHLMPRETAGGGRKKRRATTDTKKESLAMWKKGYSITEIADRRDMTESTIEGHLAHFVAEGSLAIGDMVDKAVQAKIRQAISLHGTAALRPLKDEVGEEISYGQIKMVIADTRGK
ncbi:DNA helicase RecQ [Roseivirga sp. BDSF3-8]|uniref:DNA helicase RecQ n=1 Tax=Roseivirga sp. BDSF3-8 TaxID=3241598 RepID=UPI0035323F01